MKSKKIFLFANPVFDFRYQSGISRLYQIFCKEAGFILEIVDLDFLRQNNPEQEYSQTLVIAGGDGTIHQALNAIPDYAFKKYIWGIIPAGTANEFAKSLFIPVSLYKSAELIKNPEKIQHQHIGIVNNQYKFTTGLLYGMASHILEVTPSAAKYFFGHFAYYIGVLNFLFQFYESRKVTPQNFIINARKFRTNYLLINNASLISKNLKNHDLKNEDKNLFSVIYLHSRLKFLDIMRVLIKHHAHYHLLHDKAVYYEQLSRIILEFDEDLNFLLDGEPYKLKSPVAIEYFKEPIAVISG